MAPSAIGPGPREPEGRGAAWTEERGSAATERRGKAAPTSAPEASGRDTQPSGDDTAVSLVGVLFRLAPRLVDLIDMGERDYGLGFARGRVLWALSDSGPVVMRALSVALGVSPRTVTGLVDSLEADGWVTRSPHPADRRATIISLTPASEVTLARLTDSYRALARDLLGDVCDEDLDRCRAVIRQLDDRLDDSVSKRVAAMNEPMTR